MALPQQDTSLPQVGTETASGSVTYRSLGLGLVLGLICVFYNTFVEYIAHTGRINITHFPLALFTPFAILAIGNGILRRKQVPWAFTPTEVMVAIGMGLVGAAIPAYGLISFFLGLIAIPFYRATPENQWAGFFHQYLPEWLVPSNEGDAMRWLFEGLPSPEMPIPWSVWIVPLSGWMLFIGAIVLGSICLAVMLRKQWAEHERIAYPILHPARDLADLGEGKNPMLHDRFFWIGVAIPFGILCWNIIGYFSPGFPRIDLYRGWLSLSPELPSIHINVNWYTIGFAYFANLDILFSIVVFYIFYWFQVGIYRRLGINLSRDNAKGDPTVSLQSGGAFLALVLWGLWLARHHIRDVFVKAFRPSYPVDDSKELLSYRACAFGLIFSIVFLILWFNAVGISLGVAVVLTFGLFVCYLGVARVIAETGVVYYSWNMSHHGIANFVFGGPNVYEPATKTALALVNATNSQGKAMFMPPLVHAVKIGGSILEHRRRLIIGIGAVIVVGIASAITYSLYLGYTIGAYNFNDYPFTRYPPGVYDNLVKALRGELKWETEQYYFLLSGAALFSVLSVIRYRVSWWPLAPIGMCVPMTHAIHSIFSLFVAWASKSIILRLGGVNLYKRCRPIFIGLLVGHALGSFVSFVVDQVWFYGAGHGTHGW